MGKSKKIEDLEDQNKKFQEYLGQIQKDLEQKSSEEFRKLTENIDKFYTGNGWKSNRFVAGENVDFMHTSEWSLNKVTDIINSISKSVFGGEPKPQGVEIVKGEEVGKALAAMSNLQLYLASRVLITLSGVLESFGSSASVTFKTQYKSEPLGNGFHLFTVMACNSYTNSEFFSNEKIIEYMYGYEVRFSEDEAKATAKIALVQALGDAIQVLATKISAASNRWADDEITDEQYDAYLQKYKVFQADLTAQLESLSGSDKPTLKARVPVAAIVLD